MNLGVKEIVVICDEAEFRLPTKHWIDPASQNDPIRGALLSEEAYGNRARNGER